MAKGGFPGMGGANMQQLMKQAQKMQQDMQRMQQELQTREFTATVGDGIRQQGDKVYRDRPCLRGSG